MSREGEAQAGLAATEASQLTSIHAAMPSEEVEAPDQEDRANLLCRARSPAGRGAQAEPYCSEPIRCFHEAHHP